MIANENRGRQQARLGGIVERHVRRVDDSFGDAGVEAMVEVLIDRPADDAVRVQHLARVDRPVEVPVAQHPHKVVVLVVVLPDVGLTVAVAVLARNAAGLRDQRDR